MGHIKVVADQKLETLSVFFRQMQTTGDFRHHIRALVGVVLTFPLADIMEQDRQSQQPRVPDIIGNAGIERLFVLVNTRPELLQFFYGKERVDIDCIDMISIMLHLAVYAFKFRDIPVQERQVMHIT